MRYIKILIAIAFMFQLVFQFAYGAFQHDRNWSTRARGMGGAFTAVSNDIGALTYNNAGLANIDWIESSFMYSKLYADLRGLNIGLTYAACVYPFHFGTFGLSYADFTSDDLYTEDALRIAFGKSITEDLSFGVGLDYLSHGYQIAGNLVRPDDPVFANGSSKANLGLNLSLLYTLKDLSLGFSANHINQPDIGIEDRDIVPAEYRLGAAYTYNRFVIPVDLSYRDQPWGDFGDNKATLSLGFEWWINEETGIRTGFNNYEISCGFTLFKNAIYKDIDAGIEYSLSLPLEVKESMGTHQLSLVFRYGKYKYYSDETQEEFVDYDNIHPKISIKEGYSSYSDDSVELLYDDKLMLRLYKEVDGVSPYNRALKFALDLSDVMKFVPLKNKDFKLEKRDSLLYLDIADRAEIPVDYEAKVLGKTSEDLGSQWINNLKSVLLVNSNKQKMKKDYGKRVKVRQDFTAVSEIAYIYVDNKLEYTLYANYKKKTPYQRAKLLGQIISQYINTKIGQLSIVKQSAYNEHYLVIKNQKAVVSDGDAEILDMDPEDLLNTYADIATRLLVKP